MARKTDYSTHKKQRNIRLTDEAYEGLKIFAQSLDVSVSELFERMGRKHVAETDYRRFLKRD